MRSVYVLRSLKRPEEVELLRDMYAEHFALLGVWAGREMRVTKLAQQIAESEGSLKHQNWRERAERLVCIDEIEPDTNFGQHVRDTFPMADYFVDASRPEALARGVERFIKLLFGHPFVTPTRDESGMSHAYVAALRSAALGRQVGAAVVDPHHGDLLAVGMNEVPCAGGGHAWEGDPNDDRDFHHSKDPNDAKKRAIARQVIVALRAESWLSKERTDQDIDELVTAAVDGRGPIARTWLSNLTEFGRDVHAEMSAIVSAARRGMRLDGAELFCTTFPCHNCAKHILAAGIRRVVYIEPYAKSFALELHSEAIALDDRDADASRIPFVPFVGVAPRRFASWFMMGKRKDRSGTVLAFEPAKATPWFSRSDEAYPFRETARLDTFDKLLKQVGIDVHPGGEHGAQEERD
jgi:cytidine deaminase